MIYYDRYCGGNYVCEIYFCNRRRRLRAGKGNQRCVLGTAAQGQRAPEMCIRDRGIRCGLKSTSCPDQLARALVEAKQQQNKE